MSISEEPELIYFWNEPSGIEATPFAIDSAVITSDTAVVLTSRNRKALADTDEQTCASKQFRCTKLPGILSG